MRKTCYLCHLFFFISVLFSQTAWAQCKVQVTHLSGTQQVGCTEVTVTSNGAVGNFNSGCGQGPHWIGVWQTGSYTFTFSPAVSWVSIDFYALNNNNLGTEELSFEVNGNFYPITNPGVPLTPTCGTQPGLISPTGTIQACAGCVAGWKDVVIEETISTLTIENVYISAIPQGSTFSLYIFQRDAGTIMGVPLYLCVDATANVSSATNTCLDPNDILRYILFSNLANAPGSVIAMSATPSFAFNPATMQAGVSYYIAAIIGNELNGNVDLNDPCLDISNPIPVFWWPPPTVMFSVDNPDVCPGGCITVTAHFTGTAPFTLTYATPNTSPVTQVFPGNTSTFQVCTAAGSPSGNLTVQATKVTDGWCSCE